MEILITQWGLDSYLNLRNRNVFSPKEYQTVIRPDVMLLKGYPNNTKFRNSKFWSVAEDLGKIIEDGYKMKWHQIGPGYVQLRLTVGIFSKESFLCDAYVKGNKKEEKRFLARFRTHLELIRKNCYTTFGRL